MNQKWQQHALQCLSEEEPEENTRSFAGKVLSLVKEQLQSKMQIKYARQHWHYKCSSTLALRNPYLVGC